MKKIHAFEFHNTSITVRRRSWLRLKAAVRLVRRYGVDWSESEILHRLATLYLQAWHGNGKKSATARRYNKEIENHRYRRVAWYASKVLYSALWGRGIHTGESISRMLDFAIRYYTPRLLEEVLSNPYSQHPVARRNHAYWATRWAQRFPKRPAPFITYQCSTLDNTIKGLKYTQETRIYTKAELFALDSAKNTPPQW